MAGVWQIHKMRQSIASVVDFYVRRYFFEHGSMGKIKSCRTKRFKGNIILFVFARGYTCICLHQSSYIELFLIKMHFILQATILLWYSAINIAIVIRCVSTVCSTILFILCVHSCLQNNGCCQLH